MGLAARSPRSMVGRGTRGRPISSKTQTRGTCSSRSADTPSVATRSAVRVLPPPDKTASIAVERLTRTFGGVAVLDSLSLAVEPGERVALFGPNGSGKTTLLRCVLGTVTPTSGTVTVGGHRAGTFAARSLDRRLAGAGALVLPAPVGAREPDPVRPAARTLAQGRGRARRRADAGAGAGRGCSSANRSLLDRPAAAVGVRSRLAGGAAGAAPGRADALTRSGGTRARLGCTRPASRPGRGGGKPSRRRHRVVRQGVPTRRRSAWAGGGGRMIRYAAPAALARRDFEITRSYRTLFVLDLFWGAIEVLFYYFFSQIVGLSPRRRPGWCAVVLRLRAGRADGVGRDPVGYVVDLDPGARGAADRDARVHLRQSRAVVRVRARDGGVPVPLRLGASRDLPRSWALHSSASPRAT